MKHSQILELQTLQILELQTLQTEPRVISLKIYIN